MSDQRQRGASARKSNARLVSPPVGEGESPEARRPGAAGGAVQHRGAHRPLLLPHGDEHLALEAHVRRSVPKYFYNIKL